MADIKRLIESAKDKVVDISHIDSIKRHGHEFKRMTKDGVYIFNQATNEEEYHMWGNLSNDLVMKLFDHYIVKGLK